MSTVSIIVTCYNTEKFARDCLLSAMNQTYKDLEIICVNDGSTDKTGDILAELAATDSRIKIVTQPNSGKNAGAMNTGLKHVTGDDIFVLDGDDTISPDAIEKLKNRQIETDADFVILDMCIIYPDAPEKNWAFTGVTEKPGRTNDHIDRSVILTNKEALSYTLFTWNISLKGLYRKKLFDHIRYSEEGTNGDEYAGRELLMASNKIVFSEGEYHYIQHGSSITHKITPRYFDMFRSDEKIHDILVKNDFPAKTIRDYRKFRIKKLANYQRVYAEQKDLLSPAEKQQIEQIFSEAYTSWRQNIRGTGLYTKGKYLYNYLKRRYKRA